MQLNREMREGLRRYLAKFRITAPSSQSHNPTLLIGLKSGHFRYLPTY